MTVHTHVAQNLSRATEHALLVKNTLNSLCLIFNGYQMLGRRGRPKEKTPSKGLHTNPSNKCVLMRVRRAKFQDLCERIND